MTLPSEVTPLLLSGGVYSQARKSLRFRASASAYLSRTPASAGNRKTWTWSAWVKLGVNNLASTPAIFNGGYNTAPWTAIIQETSGAFQVTYSAGQVPGSITNSVFRDPSSWYHLVWATDTTQATASNRVNFYVNGVLQTFASTNYPAQNYDTNVNNTVAHTIGGWAGQFFDGCITEVTFVDGQALTPSSFGAYNGVTGVWQPIRYTGTYGTNGYYLPFTNATSTTTLGYDQSGTGNNWTPNNISLTNDATYDSMLDIPSPQPASGNAGNIIPGTRTLGNYGTMNPLDSSATLSNANLSVSCAANNGVTGTFALTTSSFYWENTIVTSSATATLVGVLATGQTSSVRDLTAGGIRVLARNDGTILLDNTTAQSGLTAWSNGDVIACSFNAKTNSFQFYRNGSAYGSTVTASSGYTYVAYCGATNTSSFNVNFGQRPYAYTPPAGFASLCSTNLPTPTIAAGNKYFDVYLYTGNGTANRSLTGLNFQPDFVWNKTRSTSQNHILNDSVRGPANNLYSDLTNAADATTFFSAFLTNGIATGTASQANSNAVTYVNWNWNAGSGTTSTNTAGTITSTVTTCVNQTAGFSVVRYGGTGTTATVGHGLGQTPSMIIVKVTTISDNWLVYHSGLANPATDTILLNSTSAVQTGTSNWNSTLPTSSVFSVFNPGSGNYTNANGQTYIAYCWAAIPGYSAFGSYTYSSSGTAQFVYLGFRPRFILIKCISNAGGVQNYASWLMMDTSRSPYNTAQQTLWSNLSVQEGLRGDGTTAVGNNCNIDILSNGFNVYNAASVETSASGFTYIYAAFAENPFRYSLAR